MAGCRLLPVKLLAILELAYNHYLDVSSDDQLCPAIVGGKNHDLVKFNSDVLHLFLGEMSPGNCPQTFEQEEGGFGGEGWMMGWGWGGLWPCVIFQEGAAHSITPPPPPPPPTSSTDYCHAFYKPPPTQMIKRPWS